MPDIPMVASTQAMMRVVRLPIQSAKKLKRMLPKMGPQKSAL